jgi:hypothetical protein
MRCTEIGFEPGRDIAREGALIRVSTVSSVRGVK